MVGGHKIKEVNQRLGRLIPFILAGAVAGYILMHPFEILAYILSPGHPKAFWDAFLLVHQVHAAFGAEMLVMGLAFSVIGGVAGLGLGAWYLQKERLVQEQLETERRQAALNTVRELMVTLAHHIRNANMVVGGFSEHPQKHITEPELRRQLKLIHHVSHEIDEVILSLENLSQVDHIQYLDGWHTKMIDLQKELEARLQSGKAKEV